MPIILCKLLTKIKERCIENPLTVLIFLPVQYINELQREAIKMAVQYFTKMVNAQPVEIAVAHTPEQAKALRDQNFEPCSRAFYESVLRESNKVAAK
jgi:hypothetical protein